MSQSQAVGQGRRVSVEALVREHSQPLSLWLGSRLPRNDIENASQEVWLRVAKHYDTKFDGINFRAWLFQIARNYLIDESRRHKVLPLAADDGDVRPDPRAAEPCQILIDRDFRRRFAACIDKLGEPRRGIVKAKAAGLGYDEFIVGTKMTKQQASQHFFAAKKLLRACMETSGGESVI
jgi:RNA polymerase sigma factor (sigma-70 family)